MNNTLWPSKSTSARKPRRVFVGLSGGVDSAVSAALLKKAGHEVVGVFIRIQIQGYPCPAALDRIEAMRVAAHLGIAFIEVDLSGEYAKEVLKPSILEFEKGYTPNPDTLCNEKIKFGAFFDFCMSQGADAVATGHYAQIQKGELYTSKDSEKDQSYFLWSVPQKALEKTLFPVGGLTKKEVRALALRFALPNAKRHDSQGLCFLGDISLEEMLRRELPLEPGVVLSQAGEVIGEHRGVALYTLGQRHGFELNRHGENTPPHYVVGKDAKANTITVSTSRFPTGTSATRVMLEHTNWIGEVESGEYKARYRYRGNLIPTELYRDDKTHAVLEEPHYVPKGQSLVLYRGERCLGGGVIRDATLLKYAHHESGR
jgi:tRNA-specific 2-thiouridylase